MKIIETERLLLRDLRRSDWQAVHEYASDPEVVRYMDWGPRARDLQRTARSDEELEVGSFETPVQSLSLGPVLPLSFDSFLKEKMIFRSYTM